MYCHCVLEEHGREEFIPAGLSANQPQLLLTQESPEKHVCGNCRSGLSFEFSSASWAAFQTHPCWPLVILFLSRLAMSVLFSPLPRGNHRPNYLPFYPTERRTDYSIPVWFFRQTQVSILNTSWGTDWWRMLWGSLLTMYLVLIFVSVFRREIKEALIMAATSTQHHFTFTVAQYEPV